VHLERKSRWPGDAYIDAYAERVPLALRLFFILYLFISFLFPFLSFFLFSFNLNSRALLVAVLLPARARRASRAQTTDLGSEFDIASMSTRQRPRSRRSFRIDLSLPAFAAKSRSIPRKPKSVSARSSRATLASASCLVIESDLSRFDDERRPSRTHEHALREFRVLRRTLGLRRLDLVILDRLRFSVWILFIVVVLGLILIRSYDSSPDRKYLSTAPRDRFSGPDLRGLRCLTHFAASSGRSTRTYLDDVGIF